MTAGSLVGIEGLTVHMAPPTADVVAWLAAVGGAFAISNDGRVAFTWRGCDPLADALIGLTVNGTESVFRVRDVLALLRTAPPTELAAAVAAHRPAPVTTVCYRCGVEVPSDEGCGTCHPSARVRANDS